jgi:hypothetical protein
VTRRVVLLATTITGASGRMTKTATLKTKL